MKNTLKKIILTLLVATFLMVAIAISSYAITAGDVNGDGIVDADDAIRVLFHIYFENDENYSVNQNCDFKKDGIVDADDAIYLLFHVYFPADYPIQTYNLTHIEAKAATCTENGNEEYWYCSECEKYFSDENGETEIAENSWIIPATGHTVDETEWLFDNYIHWHPVTCEHRDIPVYLNPSVAVHNLDDSHKCTICDYVEKCTVTFVDFDGSVIDVKSINWGTAFENIEKPDNPQRDGHTFVNWGEVPKTIMKDIVLTAQYSEILPVITFKYIGVDNEEHTVNQTVAYGSTPIPPSTNEMSYYKFVWEEYHAYAFSRWDSDLEPATKDKTYMAVYDGLYDRPIVAVNLFVPNAQNKNKFAADIILCNLKSNTRKLYVFNFEMDYNAEGGTYSIDSIEFNTAAGWFNTSADNYTCDWNNKTKSMSFVWSTPNLSNQNSGTPLINNEYEDIITILFVAQGPINYEYITIVPDSCQIIISDDGGETMQVIQPIILYNYN